MALLEQKGLIQKHQKGHPSWKLAFKRAANVVYEFKHTSADGEWSQRVQLAVYGAMRAHLTGKVVKCVLLNTSTPSRLEFNVHPARAIEAMEMLIANAQLSESPDERSALIVFFAFLGVIVFFAFLGVIVFFAFLGVIVFFALLGVIVFFAFLGVIVFFALTGEEGVVIWQSVLEE
ncbi:hypothetical protein T492DRAFT_855618, partial [Pavlovales sp. CCMP2436]